MATKKVSKKSAATSKKKATAKVVKKSASAKAASKSSAPKKASKGASKKTIAKRELIAPKGDKRYARRDSEGEFSESDDVGKSLSQDVKKTAKKTIESGQGDRGDQKQRK